MVRTTRSTRTTQQPPSTTVLTYNSFSKTTKPVTPSRKRKQSPTCDENHEGSGFNNFSSTSSSPTNKRIHLSTTSRLVHVAIPVKSGQQGGFGAVKNEKNVQVQAQEVKKPLHLLPPFFAFYTALPLMPSSLPLANLARHLHTDPKTIREMVVVSQETCLKLSTSTGRGLGEMVYMPACNPLLIAKAREEIRNLVMGWDRGEILGAEQAQSSQMMMATPPTVKKEEVEDDGMDIDMDDAPAVPSQQERMTFDLSTRNRILAERIRSKLPVFTPSKEATVRAVAESKAVHVTGVLTGMLLCSGGRRSFSVDEVVERVMGSVSGMGRGEVECALEILSCGRPVNGVAVKLVEARGVKAVMVRRV